MKSIKPSRIKKLKWGAAGCGRFTEFTFIPTLHLLRRSSLNSVFSGDIKRAKDIAEKNGAPNYFNNYDEFIKSDIDAVYVGSANDHHYEEVIKAAEAGKHILCEKPIAMTSAEAEKMINVCKKNNVQLSINYSTRFHPLILKAKELIDKQMLGKLISINLNYNFDMPPSSNYRFVKAKGGGPLRDVGTHMIDLLRFFGGEITGINGVMDNIIYQSEVEDFAAAICNYKNGGYGYFNVSFNSKKAFNRIEILGHKGTISIDQLIGVKNATSKLNILLESEARKTFRKRANKFFNLLKSVQKSFLQNEEPLITGEDGYINLRLMEELERKCHR